MSRVIVAPSKRDGDFLSVDAERRGFEQALIEVVRRQVCREAFLIASAYTVEREVVVDRDGVVKRDVVACNVVAEHVRLACERTILDLFCRRHACVEPMKRYFVISRAVHRDGCRRCERELVEHVVFVAHTVGHYIRRCVEAVEINSCSEAVGLRIADCKSVEEEVLAFDVRAAFVGDDFVFARCRIIDPLDCNVDCALAFRSLYVCGCRQLPLVVDVVAEAQNFCAFACHSAAEGRKFAFSVGKLAARKRIRRDIDVDCNLVVADQCVDRLRDAVVVCIGHDGFKRSDVCDIAVAFDEVDKHRSAVCNVAPIARLEVVGTILCKVDRIDTERFAVNDVRLLIYAAGVVVLVGKFGFKLCRHAVHSDVRSKVAD